MGRQGRAQAPRQGRRCQQLLHGGQEGLSQEEDRGQEGGVAQEGQGGTQEGRAQEGRQAQEEGRSQEVRKFPPSKSNDFPTPPLPSHGDLRSTKIYIYLM